MPQSFLYDRRLLILEDETLIAMQLEDIVRSLGCRSVAVTGSQRSALERVETLDLDFALVDCHVGGDLCDAVMHSLAAANVPFAIVTGDPESVASHFADVPVVPKPFSPNDIEQALLKALLASAGSEAIPIAGSVTLLST